MSFMYVCIICSLLPYAVMFLPFQVIGFSFFVANKCCVAQIPELCPESGIQLEQGGGEGSK